MRRNDNWITSVDRTGVVPRAATDPLVIDLGFGSTAVTTIELAGRIHRRWPSARVLGLEIDPARVQAALPFARPPAIDFTRGGFEFGGRQPNLDRFISDLDRAWAAAAPLAVFSPVQRWVTAVATLSTIGWQIGDAERAHRRRGHRFVVGYRPVELIPTGGLPVRRATIAG